jgi:hypothetical protein
MRLTNLNYFTTKNRYISNSKINDFLKSKEYFYKKHVSGDIPSKITDALIIGKAVDVWLTGSRALFDKQFVRVERRSKADSDNITELTPMMYDDIVGMCEAVEKTTAYKTLKKSRKQVILQHNMDLGMFDGICGIPDFLSIMPATKQAIIYDLKTSATIDKNKYYYHCLEYGYFRQQALYQMLVEKNFKINNIISKHLVVGKDPDKIFKVAAFELDQREIDMAKKHISSILTEIKAETKFKDLDVSWNNATIITNPRQIDGGGEW